MKPPSVSTRAVLRVFADAHGRSVTVEQVAEQAGLDVDQARRMLIRLRATGQVLLVPDTGRYVLTAQGQARVREVFEGE
jgi:DNA-binding IclR family transcriptional regulator